MLGVVKAACKSLVGAIFGFLSVAALSPALAAFSRNDGETSVAVTLGIISFCVVLCIYTGTFRHAFGRGFLYLGCSVFALPISAFLLSSRVALDVANIIQDHSDGVALAAVGVAGVAITSVSALIGFFLGSILLIVGIVLVLGGRTEVIVVNDDA